MGLPSDIAIGPDARRPGRAWDLFFFAAAVGMTLLLRPAFLTDWDSFDYTAQAVQFVPSSLATERMFFIAIHAAVWRAAHALFNLDVTEAWLALSAATMVLGGLAAVAVFRAAWWLTRSRGAAILAGLLWIASPQAMIYGSAVMTETPTILFFALAIVLAERSVDPAASRSAGRAAWLAGGAGGLFAVAVNMREPLVLFAAYFLGRMVFPGRSGSFLPPSQAVGGPAPDPPPSRTTSLPPSSRGGGRERVNAPSNQGRSFPPFPPAWRLRAGRLLGWATGFAVVFAVGLLLAAWRRGGWDVFVVEFQTWASQMAEERREYPNSPAWNALIAAAFSLTVSLPGVFWATVSLPMLAGGLLRKRTQESPEKWPEKTTPDPVFWGPLGWLALGGGLYLASLLLNHDTPVNVRFVLPLMMPILILDAAALAWAVRTRSRGWLSLFMAAGGAGLAMMTLAVTVRVPQGPAAADRPLLELMNRFIVPYMEADKLLAWSLAGLVGGLLAVLLLKLARHGKAWVGLASAGGAVVLLTAFVLTVGWNWLDDAFWRTARWQKELLGQIAAPAPAGLPPDAMLVPGPATPAIQYLIKLGAHPGSILPGPMSDEELRRVGRLKGWVIVPSGWLWPDGVGGKPILISADPGQAHRGLVCAYQAAGKPVYVYGGPCNWKPGKGRRIEWPQIQQLQLLRKIDLTGPGDMCLVQTTRPDRGEPLIPLGLRKIRLLERQRAEQSRSFMPD